MFEDVPPISAEEIRGRQQLVREAAAAAGYDGLVVVGRSFYDRPGDLAYLTNHFPPFPTTVFSEGNRGMGHAILLLPVLGEPVLLTDARKHRPDLVVVDDVRAAGDLGIGLIELLKETYLEDANLGLVGDDILPAAIDRQLLTELPGLTLEPEPNIVAKLRAIKSPSELALLRRAALCADAALMTANAMIRRGGVTEREVCAEAIAAAMRAGADFVRYFRVHSGPWSAYGSRWPQAMDRTIEPGEIVALDAIGAYQGYGFDVNRTTVCGEPNAESRRLLETTQNATEAAVAQIRAGVTVATVADAAVDVMKRGQYGDYFAGMMGHGIGLETVELPYLKIDEPTILQPGMVICVEPGLSIPDVAGAAIEQEVIVPKSGPAEIITPTPTNLWEVG
ncbi:MAG: aminopeptidase P family protein [Thermomicrobiales bacterium]|nr:aminopeptidase P family protein [Thermomicrobiales bacterium]MCO5222456.1 Xaa-Pro peptidase family protein [Thermomicrobiales bacterium]